MTDLRAMLDREAGRIAAEPHALDRVRTRVRQRRRRERAVAAVAALTIAAGGIAVTVRAFRGPEPPPEPAIGPFTGRLERPAPGVWPEAALVDLERAQERAARGELDWRLSPTETARRFAVQLLNWNADDVVVTFEPGTPKRYRQRPFGAAHLLVSNPALADEMGVPASYTQHALLMRQWLETGPGGVWSVSGSAPRSVDIRTADPRRSVPGGTRIRIEGTLSEPRGETEVRASLFVGPYRGGARFAGYGSASLGEDGRFTALLPAVPEGLGGWAQIRVTTFVAGRDVGIGIWNLGALGDLVVSTHADSGQVVSDVAARAHMYIVRAAGVLADDNPYHEGGYRMLRRFLAPDFLYAPGRRGDPIGYWKKRPNALFQRLQDLLSTPVGVAGEMFVWPGASLKDPDELTDEDQRVLLTVRAMTTAGLERWRRTGTYPGWWTGIRQDGTWVFFLKGPLSD